MGRRREMVVVGCLLIAGLIVVGKWASKSRHPAASLAPLEVFHWSDQAIAFSPPAGDAWTRERHAEADCQGVAFTRYQAPPSRMTISEYMLTSRRDHRGQLAELLQDFDKLTEREFRHEIGLARLPLDDPLSTAEVASFRRANAALDRAASEFWGGHPRSAPPWVEQAMRELGSISYDVADVQPRLRLVADQFTFADSAFVADSVEREVGGLPALQTDYAISERSMLHTGRRIFAVTGMHTFVFEFLGRPTDLPLFEQLVASATFEASIDSSGALEVRP
jgi:hypothetical protein